MKLTESRIKQIILEEMEKISSEKDAQQEPKEKLQSDVLNIQKLLKYIDNQKEYMELLSIVLSHDFGNDQQKNLVLRKVRDEINKIIK